MQKTRRYLERAVVPHYRKNPPAKQKHFVDEATDEIMKRLGTEVFGGKAVLRNTDRPPYIHVQSVGYVAAVDECVEPPEGAPWVNEVQAKSVEQRNAMVWGATRDKVLSVSIHPVFGGWFAYRILALLPDAHDEIPRPPPRHFVSEEAREVIITEYNLRHQLCLWRDLPNMKPENRYSPQAFLYFCESDIQKRARFMEMAIAALKAEEESREARKVKKESSWGVRYGKICSLICCPA
eukprot:GEMP01042075.1.p1 GENE.GEMP01042075.1~~GEMP01042075.1.p1  ORF type:complete len:237 (+),score=54.19 GEMP01042075.1:219-929(+)